jgi:hypothetical protein
MIDASLTDAQSTSQSTAPATLGACQVRLQLSMLLQPITARTNFCAT